MPTATTHPLWLDRLIGLHGSTPPQALCSLQQERPSLLTRILAPMAYVGWPSTVAAAECCQRLLANPRSLRLIAYRRLLCCSQTEPAQHALGVEARRGKLRQPTSIARYREADDRVVGYLLTYL